MKKSKLKKKSSIKTEIMRIRENIGPRKVPVYTYKK